MTEQEWLGCTDPQAMLEFVRGKVSDRKVRLFDCACCRRIWHLLIDERSRRAVEVAEEYADGILLADELHSVRLEATKAYYLQRNAAVAVERKTTPLTDPGGTAYFTAWTSAQASRAAWNSTRVKPGTAGIRCIVAVQVHANASASDPGHAVQNRTGQEMARIQAKLGSDIFGNLFRSVAINPNWLTTTVRNLASTIYEECTFDRLPILADALQDAGCDNGEILNHFRQPGEHVRGCWSLDLIIGKV